jgi:hypothetical protein
VAGLEPQLHVGEAVFEGLIRRQLAAEGIPVEGVLGGELQDPVRGARHLRAFEDGGDLQLALDVGCRIAGADQGGARDGHIVEPDLPEPPHQVEAVHRDDGEAERVARDQELDDPLAATVQAGADQEPVGLACGLDHGLGPRQDEPVAVGPSHELDVARPPAAAGLIEAPGGDHVTAHDAGQDVGLLLWRPRGGQSCGHDVGGMEGARRHHAPELLGDDRQVGQPAARQRAAAVPLGHQEPRPAQLRAAAPPATVEARRVAGQFPYLGQRRLALQEPPGGLLEEALLRVERQVQGLAPPWGAMASITSAPKAASVSGSAKSENQV